jgi:dihydropyrimidinase/dihydroorotase
VETNLTLRNGLVVTPGGLLRGGLSITGGRITHVGADATLSQAERDIDVEGRVIFPGIIDPHVHLGIGPGAGSEKVERDFRTESRDAARGGVTTMITTTLFGGEPRGEIAEEGIRLGQANSVVDFRLTGVITQRQHLAEIADLTKLGVKSFKFFLGYKGAQAESFGMNADGISWDFFYQACEALGEAGAQAFPTIHAEDPWVRGYLNDVLRSRHPRLPADRMLQTWLQANPNILEPMQIYPAALIASEVGVPVYVVHTSAWQSVDLIRALKDQGIQVYGETLAAFLYWTAAEADAKSRGVVGKVQPPIRAARDRDALWKGILDGTITSVGTDCQMYPRETRMVDFWDARVGLGPGMSTLLSATYSAGVAGGRCTLEDLARVLSENNARRFGLYPRKGVLAAGSDADVVVFDPGERQVVDETKLPSASEYSLYHGETLAAWPWLVLVRGNTVVRDGAVVGDPGIGRHIGDGAEIHRPQECPGERSQPGTST